MIEFLDLPVAVRIGSTAEASSSGFRSYPDADNSVSCATAAVDAEWDRPRPRVPQRLTFSPRDPAEAPFWACWTAKEALYKSQRRDVPFVPARFPLHGWREIPPPTSRVLRFFEWDGGFSACVREPGPGARLLWIAVAAVDPGPRVGPLPDEL